MAPTTLTRDQLVELNEELSNKVEELEQALKEASHWEKVVDHILVAEKCEKKIALPAEEDAAETAVEDEDEGDDDGGEEIPAHEVGGANENAGENANNARKSGEKAKKRKKRGSTNKGNPCLARVWLMGGWLSHPSFKSLCSAPAKIHRPVPRPQPVLHKDGAGGSEENFESHQDRRSQDHVDGLGRR